MGLVDFLVEHIHDEATDAGTYMEWAASCNDTKTKEVLNAIGKQELEHQKMLVGILANMAKGGANV